MERSAIFERDHDLRDAVSRALDSIGQLNGQLALITGF